MGVTILTAIPGIRRSQDISIAYAGVILKHNQMHTHKHTHNRFTALWNLSRTTRVSRYQKKHSPTTLMVVINHLYLLSPSTTTHGILRIQFTCSTVFFHNLSPSSLWSTSWCGTLHFILHTFLHPIIVFFTQHMPIPLQPVPL